MARALLLLLPPLAGFLVLGVFGRGLTQRAVSLIGCGSVLLSLVGAVYGVGLLLSLPAGHRFSDPVYFTWASAGSATFPYGLYWDPLSAVMALVVTGVGFLIHVYAVGYMRGDPGYPRFFAYMNLFILAMLQLVLADNFAWLLVGWAGVGLASYLLIGFWYQRPSAVAAARKAFVVNVVGDAGLMVAAFALFAHFGSLSYAVIFPRATELLSGSSVAVVIAAGLFVACAAKSAQLPLQVWLPDAMEGPTPVSALIHAATMVTAGVYLVARAYPLFQQAPAIESLIAAVGAVTALYAGLVALTQWDIKRVIAYSTISQLGFMFVAVGLGAYSAGIFHLVTHAFFKALLFMAAGSVIHALGGEQDLRRMGALRNRLPQTHLLTWVAALSLAGIPPLAGFFSKEPIIATAYHANRMPLWLVSVAAAALTALYSLRLLYYTFWAPSKAPELAEHAHEAPLIMRVPMYLLAIGAIAAGWNVGGWFDAWLSPVFNRYALMRLPVTPPPLPAEVGYMAAVGVTLLAAALAFSAYWRNRPAPASVVAAVPWLYQWSFDAGYLDELYASLVVNPLRAAGAFAGRVLDPVVAEAGVDAVGGAALRAGGALRRLQTGYLRSYALMVGAGAALLLAFVALKR